MSDASPSAQQREEVQDAPQEEPSPGAAAAVGGVQRQHMPVRCLRRRALRPQCCRPHLHPSLQAC